MFCVWWYHRGVVCYELLKPGKTVNIKRYQQQLTDLNRSLFEKRPERGRTEKGDTKSFSSWQCFITYDKSDSRHVGSTKLRNSTPCGLFTRLGSFRLPLVCIDGSRICWATLWFFIRRCEEMARWMVRSKRAKFLRAWYSQIIRKMGKMYTKRWSTL